MHIEFNQKKVPVKTLFSATQIQTRTQALAQKINKDYGTDELLVVLIILNGSFIFAADLVRYLEMPTEIETTRLKSYVGTSSVGEVKLLNPLTENLSGKNVLIVEDIVDTGKSMDFLLKELQKYQVKSVKICTLLNKPEAHQVPLSPEYIGFDIGRNFVIGYGLDLDGRYRNLPFIGELVL